MRNPSTELKDVRQRNIEKEISWEQGKDCDHIYYGPQNLTVMPTPALG